MPWTGGLEGIYPADPPLANKPFFTASLPYPDYISPCEPYPLENPGGCEIFHIWYGWVEEIMCMTGIPGTTAPPCVGAWMVDGTPYAAWTGFFGGEGTGTPRSYWRDPVLIPPTSVGARVLGQSVNDHFGTDVGSDGTWLYISAPEHTALQADVPALSSDRSHSGVVYQLAASVSESDGVNRAQLWIEPGMTYPNVDAEIQTRLDYTMPVPHQYIIETVGSIRGNYEISTVFLEGGDCTDEYEADVADGWEIGGYLPYPTATAGYNTDRTPQIVGPHADAELSAVRGLGDIDGDGIREFAVGSPNIEDPVTGQTVGAIYVVYGRAVGVQGDYLLENLHLAPSAPNRLKGIMLKGTSAGETLARVLDNAGDFNNDGYADVIVGNEGANGVGGSEVDSGEAIVILGSRSLESPENGWTVDGVVAAGKAIRFRGAVAGELAGANVAGAGDVDGDGFDDILIAAPGAANGDGDAAAGVVYLIYGSDSLSGEYDLADIGTVDLPGVKFVGRSASDQLGGGEKLVSNTGPGGQSTIAVSRGVTRLGDIDGDNHDDIAISAMLADPEDRQDAGEVYIIYGRGD